MMTLDELIAYLDGGLERRAEAYWGAFCRETAADAQSRAPAGSGKLRESMECTVVRTGNAVAGEIVFTAPHAVFVHEGTGKYRPSGRKTRWVYAVEKDGGVQFYTTEGQPPVPYLREALEAAAARLEGGEF